MSELFAGFATAWRDYPVLVAIVSGSVAGCVLGLAFRLALAF